MLGIPVIVAVTVNGGRKEGECVGKIIREMLARQSIHWGTEYVVDVGFCRSTGSLPVRMAYV